MGKSALRLAAQTVRVLPRKRLSRALGRLAASQAPQRVVDAAVAAFVRAYDVDLSEVDIPADGFRTFDDFFTRKLLALLWGPGNAQYEVFHWQDLNRQP